jgi:hypothetical protein
MKINLKKTKIIVFRNGGYLRESETWTYNGEYIETVSCYKYMGILFTPKLIWTKAQQALATQSKKSIISILKLKKNVGYFEYTELFKLFDTMVTSILTYGSEIWGYKYAHIIENVHNQFCCRYLKLYKNTFHSFVRGECGRYFIHHILL